MVVATEKMEELDKATDTMNLMHEIDIYVLLQKIKYADERDAVIDEALKVSRFKLENVWKLDAKLLNELNKLRDADKEVIRLQIQLEQLNSK